MKKTKCKDCFKVPAQENWGSTALLILRLIVGVAFVLHGWGKIQNPFAWMGPDAPVPGFFQFLAALSEFGGGLALIVGFLTKLAALGLTFTMIAATGMHMFVMKDPFVNQTGGSSYELALVYLGISLLFLMMGPGKFSLDSKIFGEKK
ncbi:MAG: DoxX family protein [Oligoflexia bacterium]|nr:DoxX family protein [Oligoflexia bacterium]